MKRFSFIYISLAILALACFSPKIGIFNAKTLSAAPIHEEYQEFLPNTDNETQYEHSAMHPTEKQMRQWVYLYYSAPIEGETKISSGPMPISPANDSTLYSVDKTSFSWTPLKNTTTYIFTLSRSRDIEAQIIDLRINLTTPSYIYDGILDYNTDYYWQVMALDPMESEWSAIFHFRTEAAPAQAAPPTSPTPSPQSEAPPKPSFLPTILIIVMLTALLAAMGLITWVLVAKKHTAK
jgi:hypothetical protein